MKTSFYVVEIIADLVGFVKLLEYIRNNLKLGDRILF